MACEAAKKKYRDAFATEYLGSSRYDANKTVRVGSTNKKRCQFTAISSSTTIHSSVAGIEQYRASELLLLHHQGVPSNDSAFCHSSNWFHTHYSGLNIYCHSFSFTTDDTFIATAKRVFFFFYTPSLPCISLQTTIRNTPLL